MNGRATVGWVRGVRALAVSGLAVGQGFLAHASMVGMSVTPGGLALAWVVLIPFAWALAGRRLGWITLTGSLSVGQAVTHLAFVITAQIGATIGPVAPHAAIVPASLGHSGHPLAPSTMPMDGAAMAATPGMVGAHLLMVFLGVVLLAWGEHVLWAVCRLWHLPVADAVVLVVGLRERIVLVCPSLARVVRGPAQGRAPPRRAFA